MSKNTEKEKTKTKTKKKKKKKKKKSETTTADAEKFEYTRPLTPKFVSTVTRPGQYYDGPGSSLCLRVRSPTSRYWETRFTFNGVRRTYSLGPFRSVSLRDARIKAREVGDLARAGHDPFVRRRRAPVLTVREAAEKTIELRRRRWSNPDREARIWRRTFETYVYPVLGRLRITDVTPADVLDLLTRVDERFPKNVTLVRQRLGAVLKWAVLTGRRVDNPAAGNLFTDYFDSYAPDHHRALAFQDVPGALARVRTCDAWLGTRLLLEFLVLTAVRTNEARGALWPEVNLEAGPVDRPCRAHEDEKGCTRCRCRVRRCVSCVKLATLLSWARLGSAAVCPT